MNGRMCFCLISFTFENTIWSMFVKNRLRQQAVFLRLGNLSSLLPSISFFSCFGRLQNGNSSLLRASSLRCWRWRLLGLRMAKLVYFGDTVRLAPVLLFTTPLAEGQKELGHLVKAEQLTWWMVFFWIDLSPLKELWPKRPLWSLGMQLWCERVSLDYPSTVLCGGSHHGYNHKLLERLVFLLATICNCPRFQGQGGRWRGLPWIWERLMTMSNC